MYPEYARNTHSHYVTAPRRPDFSLDADHVLAAIAAHNPTIVIITTPNNPTGHVDAAGGARGDRWPAPRRSWWSTRPTRSSRGTRSETALTLLAEYGNLVVSRTMSKAFALAGGRVGYLAAAPAIVDACRIVRLPYHLSAQTQAIARVALAHAPEMLAQVDLLRTVRDEMLRRLPQLGVEVIDSDANFCLFGRFADRHDVWQRLLDRGVLVRETGPGRLPAGLGREHRRRQTAFYTALAEVLEEIR